MCNRNLPVSEGSNSMLQVRIINETKMLEYPTSTTILKEILQNSIYDILDSIIIDNQTWYLIEYDGTRGYINSDDTEIISTNDNALSLLFTCQQTNYYYVKLYEGEELYIKKV